MFRPNMLLSEVPARFIAAGGSAFLYAYSGTPKAAIPSIVATVKTKLEALPADRRKTFRILERKELDELGADSTAILALSGTPGLVFSGSVEPAKTIDHGPGTKIQADPLAGLFVPVTGGHHGYDPRMPDMYTGFIACGAEIRKGRKIEKLRVTDIAPLIAALLKIELKTPDGKLMTGIIMQDRDEVSGTGEKRQGRLER
jgi:hypothetical protein